MMILYQFAGKLITWYFGNVVNCVSFIATLQRQMANNGCIEQL